MVATQASERTGEADHRVLQRVAAGDTDAFALLVDRHQERLLRVCRRMLGDPEEARDAAQEVFLKAWRKAASYEPRGQVYTWLYRIAMNHCLNQLRRRKVVRFLQFAAPGDDEAEGLPVLDPPSDAPGPDEALAARRRWRRARRAIAALPPNQRAVLVLAKFEGLAYKEIAEVLGVSLSAVESRLFRAVRSLEAALGDDGEGDRAREGAQDSGAPRVSGGRGRGRRR